MQQSLLLGPKSPNTTTTAASYKSSSTTSSTFDLSTVPNDHELRHKVLQKLQTTPFQYYVYDNPNITRPQVRQRAAAGQFTWRQQWGQRYKEFAIWELRYLQALEASSHPFRTYNASEADLIIINIPWCALITAGRGNEMRETIDALYADPTFANPNHRHVLFSFLETLFEKPLGLTAADYRFLVDKPNLTVAKISDAPITNRIPFEILQRGYWNTFPKQRAAWQTYPRGFSISWMGAATDAAPSNIARDSHAALTLPVLVYEKSLHVFYQTRTTTSLNNSTIFRHAINYDLEETAAAAAAAAKNNDTNTTTTLPQPLSVGWGLPAAEWWQAFRQARFCLVIRGDNPASRALWRSIQHGCIPVVVSDFLPYYSPVFRSLVQMSDYAVLVDEMQYVNQPAATIRNAIFNLTVADLQAKINGVNMVQRLILPQHEQSLFVQAFGYEALQSFTNDYYSVQGELYGQAFNTSYHVRHGRWWW